MPGKVGMTHYPAELKLEAVRLFCEEGKSHRAITEELGIRDRCRVEKWLRAYRREGVEAFNKAAKKKSPGRRPKKENSEKYIARLEMENALLKKFHTELRELRLAQRNIGRSTIIKEATQ
jgi:transposase